MGLVNPPRRRRLAFWVLCDPQLWLDLQVVDAARRASAVVATSGMW